MTLGVQVQMQVATKMQIVVKIVNVGMETNALQKIVIIEMAKWIQTIGDMEMIKEKTWNDWINGLLVYAETNYPDIKVSEKKVIDVMFKSMRTVYMEQIIIDIGEED